MMLLWLQAQALREQQIKEDVTQIKKTFFCQVGRLQLGTTQQEHCRPAAVRGVRAPYCKHASSCCKEAHVVHWE